MAKTLKEINQMECNVKARKKYDATHFKYQSVKFKLEEIEAVDAYCKANNLSKNTFFRQVIMDYINKHK